MVQRPDDDADVPDERAAGGAATPGSGAPDSQRDFDERWARIVAELGEQGGEPWPDNEADRSDDEADEPAGADPTAGAEPADGAGRRGGHVVRPAADARPDAAPDAGRVLSGRDWDGTAQYDAAEEAVDEQEHFVPPDPGPVLGSDPLRILTWLVAIGVPVLYVVMLLGWRDAPGWLAPVAGVLFLGAVGVLVWRMPHRRDRDGGDSGAVV
jgi:hypothetical protein